MNRRELAGWIVEELNKVLPDGEEELDGDDLETVENTITGVLTDAEEAIDETEEEDEPSPDEPQHIVEKA